MAHCETLPNGVVIRVTQPLSDEERAALSEYLDAARDAVQANLAAMSPEDRQALEDRQAEGRARLRRMRERAANPVPYRTGKWIP
jgi:hypothetical protein